MKVLVYCNTEKDPGGLCLECLKSELSLRGAEFDLIDLDEEPPKTHYDGVFVIGGDGTILRRTEYANENGVPIIGINAGKLGFLSEFERAEIPEAVEMFLNGELVKDLRATLLVKFKGKKYYALNDAVVQRLYNDMHGAVLTAGVEIDDVKVDTVCGDGVIVATPTGSTAYSLSAGGAILAPGINAFLITPIAAHSFSQRPVVYSSSSKCVVTLLAGDSTALVIDGKMVETMGKGENVEIVKADKPTIFLRRKTFNFFDRLTEKLKDRPDERL
mgnify:FL=1